MVGVAGPELSGGVEAAAGGMGTDFELDAPSSIEPSSSLIEAVNGIGEKVLSRGGVELNIGQDSGEVDQYLVDAINEIGERVFSEAEISDSMTEPDAVDEPVTAHLFDEVEHETEGSISFISEPPEEENKDHGEAGSAVAICDEVLEVKQSTSESRHSFVWHTDGHTPLDFPEDIEIPLRTSFEQSSWSTKKSSGNPVVATKATGKKEISENRVVLDKVQSVIQGARPVSSQPKLIRTQSY